MSDSNHEISDDEMLVNITVLQYRQVMRVQPEISDSLRIQIR